MATREGQVPFLQICKLPIQSITGLIHLFFPPGHQHSSCLIKKNNKIIRKLPANASLCTCFLSTENGIGTPAGPYR